VRPGRRRLAAAAAGALLIIAAVAAGILLAWSPAGLPQRPPSQRPQLLLLTSLPILFPETLTLRSEPPAVLAALQARYTLVPISLADRSSLGAHRLLLMIHPQAQPPQVLVELDDWVRRGGRVLLLADPALEWPSVHPLGSLLRPPLAYPDTGLLLHWGVRLEAPDTLAPQSVSVGGETVRTLAPGRLVATSPDCAVESSGFIARCRVGKGRATVIADADFLNVGGSSESRSANLTLLLRELDRLEP
jgi:hypothetical protein